MGANTPLPPPCLAWNLSVGQARGKCCYWCPFCRSRPDDACRRSFQNEPGGAGILCEVDQGGCGRRKVLEVRFISLDIPLPSQSLSPGHHSRLGCRVPPLEWATDRGFPAAGRVGANQISQDLQARVQRRFKLEPAAPLPAASERRDVGSSFPGSRPGVLAEHQN